MGTVFASAARIEKRQSLQYSHAPARFTLFGLLSLVACGGSDSSPPSSSPPSSGGPTPAAATGVLDTADFAAADGFIVQGDTIDDWLGVSVSAAGDVNNDGYADLIIGAGYGEASGTITGDAYVIWGRAGATRANLDTSEFSASDGFVIHGGAEYDFVGWGVSGAGDVNNDGYDDLIVGTPYGDSGGDNAGEAYVIWGKAGATRTNINTADLQASDGFVIQGDAADDRFGLSVSAAGDVNNDGIADLIVGAWKNDAGGANAGAGYVIWGKAGVTRANIDTENLATSDGFVIQGADEEDNLGYSVSAAGDINNDGYDDLVVGAYYRDAAETNVGTAYVIWGKAGATRSNIDTGALTTTDGFIISGDEFFGILGWSVSEAGDVNNDGYDDLIVGAPLDGDGGLATGVAYVIWGKAGVTRTNINVGELDVSDGFAIQGDAEDDWFGYSVSGAGDLDNDGYDDLVIGASDGDDGGESAGEAYVIWGKAGATRDDIDISSLDVSNGLIIRGHAAFDNLGYAASAAGDVNNDGYDDLIVSAHLGDDGGTDDGEAYVIWGGAHLRNAALAIDPDAGNQPIRVFAAAVETADYAFDFSNLFIDGKGTISLAYSDTESGANAGALAGAATFDAATNVLSIDDSAINEDFAIEIIATDDATTTASWRMIILADSIPISVSPQADINMKGNDSATVDISGIFSGGDGNLHITASLGLIGADAILTLTEDELQNGDNSITLTATDRDGDKETDVFIFAVEKIARSTIAISNLQTSDGFIIEGKAAGDLFGFSFSNTGDINNDGFADLIVGAPFNDSGGTASGEAYVIWGKAEATRTDIDTENLAASDGFTISGVATVVLGWSVAAAGDVNNDGFADLIIGEFGSDYGDPENGEAYVIWGKAGATRTDIDVSNLGNDGFAIQGAATDRWHAFTVSGVGDLNNDGIADLAIGVSNNESVNAIQIYVIWGKTGAARADININEFANTDGFVIDGFESNGQFLYSISAAGDVNNDGLADLLIGITDSETNPSATAGVYVVWGQEGATRSNIDISNFADIDGFIIRSDATNDEFAFSHNGAGDINGDGYDDLIVGAHDGNSGGTESGEAYVIWGKAGATRPNINTASLDASNGFIIQGDKAGDRLGFAVSAMGDFDNDGYDDLVLGAIRNDDGDTNAGAAYVIWGKQGATRANIDTTNLSIGDGLILQGGKADDFLGTVAKAPGDVNNDGYADLIVGSAKKKGSSDVGEVYVIWGGAHLRNEALAIDPVAGNQPKRVFDAAVETADYEFDFSSLFIDGQGTISLAYSDTESAANAGALTGAATFDATTDVLSIDDSAINEDFDIEIIATDDDSTAIWRIEVYV